MVRLVVTGGSPGWKVCFSCARDLRQNKFLFFVRHANANIQNKNKQKGLFDRFCANIAASAKYCASEISGASY